MIGESHQQFNSDDHVLWLTEHDSLHDVVQKTNALLSGKATDAASREAVAKCFRHCQKALSVLETDVLCAVTGRLALKEGANVRWLYVNVTRAENPSSAPGNDATTKEKKPVFDRQQEWCVMMKEGITKDEFSATVETMRELPLQIISAHFGIVPYVVIGTDVIKSINVIKAVDKISNDSGIEENKGGHLKHL
jgi:hypothetical protein